MGSLNPTAVSSPDPGSALAWIIRFISNLSMGLSGWLGILLTRSCCVFRGLLGVTDLLVVLS